MEKRKKRRGRSESMIRSEHQKKESKLWYEEAKCHAKSIHLQTALCAYNKVQHVHLDVTRETELLNQFLLVREDIDQEKIVDEGPPMLPPSFSLENKQTVKFDEDVQRKRSSLEKIDRKVAPSITAVAIAGGYGKFSGQRIEHEAKKQTVLKRQRRRKGAAALRADELYTDKDRAAAVNMGTKDIKHSLKEKRQADRSSAMRIPAEAQPGTFLALCNYEINRGDIRIARDFIDKALELNPNEKNALVARSRCYVLLGQPENGLKDAEAALQGDKTFFKAIYQKAESLYYLGDFEHSLMFYHRGHKLRPDHAGFKLGIQKSQEAIENAIGGPIFNNRRSKSTSFSNVRDSVANMTAGTITTDFAPNNNSDITTVVDNRGISASSTRTTVIAVKGGGTKASTSSANSAQENCNSGKKSCSQKSGSRKSRSLRELSVDKKYLDNLLCNPDLKCKNNEDDVTIVNSIKETIDYLNSRQEFWRQQLPPNLINC